MFSRPADPVNACNSFHRHCFCSLFAGYFFRSGRIKWLAHPYLGRSVSSVSFYILFLHKQAGKFPSRSPHLHHVLSSSLSSASLPREDLLNPLAPALNQDDQHDYRKDSGNDSNNGYIVHVKFSPFSLS